MTKEDIEERVKALEADLEKAVATVNAIYGALEDCEYWKKKLMEAEEKEAKA